MHVDLYVRTQAYMDAHAFVSLILAFGVQLLGDWNIEVSYIILYYNEM